MSHEDSVVADDKINIRFEMLMVSVVLIDDGSGVRREGLNFLCVPGADWWHSELSIKRCLREGREEARGVKGCQSQTKRVRWNQ